MRKVALLMVLILVSSIACIQVDQKITINKDGSALMEMYYAMDTTYINMMEMMKQMAAASGAETEGEEEQDWFPFNEDEVKKTYDKENFEMQSFDSYVKDGKKHIKVKVLVKDIGEFMKGDQMGEEATFSKNDKGNYVIDVGDFMGQGEETEREIDDHTREMLKGLSIHLEFTTPTKIIKTNAHDQEEKVARWIYDIEQDDSFLKNPPSIYLEFDGSGLDFLD